MKRVLIIGHFWPYRGGSKRMLGLAKHLADFGWEPIILTGALNSRPKEKCQVIEIEYPNFLGSWVKIFGFKENNDIGNQFKSNLDKKSFGFRPLLKLFYNIAREFLAYPDEDKNWEKEAVKKAEEIKNISAMISVWPSTSHLIAKKIKDKHNDIFWIADFPDLWSQNYSYPYSWIRNKIDRNLELKTIAKADVLTTVSLGLKEKLEQLHKGKKVIAIPNGFDPEKLAKKAELNKKFTITYTGLIYNGKQDISRVLSAIKELKDEGKINDFELRFYGPRNDNLEKEIKKNDLKNYARQCGELQREESLKAQRESQVLLLLNWEDENQKGVYTGKVFEYLSALRPILATGGNKNDVVEELLKETEAGVNAISKNDIKHAILNYYLDFKTNGKVSYAGKIEEINKYSWTEMARKYAEILK